MAPYTQAYDSYKDALLAGSAMAFLSRLSDLGPKTYVVRHLVSEMTARRVHLSTDWCLRVEMADLISDPGCWECIDMIDVLGMIKSIVVDLRYTMDCRWRAWSTEGGEGAVEYSHPVSYSFSLSEAREYFAGMRCKMQPIYMCSMPPKAINTNYQ
jgi:hypothetical protein